METALFLKLIEDARGYGSCQLVIYDKAENTPWEIILTQHFSMPISAKEFITLNKTQAQVILTHLFSKDMAYEAEIMPLAKASDFANAFYELFSNQARFLSNSSWGTDKTPISHTHFEPKLSGWFPLTEATFDSGIIVCDIDKVGIAWFEDED